jgi:hypothetical protein
VFCHGHHLADRVAFLVVAAAVLRPGQEHLVVEGAHGGRQEDVERGAHHFLRSEVEVAFEVGADPANEHLVLVAGG